jgi:tRNA G46 methylase TrmB
MPTSINIELDQVSIDEKGNIVIKNEKLKDALQKQQTQQKPQEEDIAEICCGGGKCTVNIKCGS